MAKDKDGSLFSQVSNLNTEEIDIIFKKVLKKYDNFNIVLSGLSISYEENNNFRNAVIQAVEAAYKKSINLGK